MFEWEQSWSCPDPVRCLLLWKGMREKNACSLQRTEPRWLQNTLGAVYETESFPLASSRELWCSGTFLHLPSPSYIAGAGSDILADVSRRNSSFAATQAKQVLLPEPKDCSHGEEQEEEQNQETPASWISCSCLLFSPSLAAPRQSQQSHGHLVPLCGCNTPLACA